MGQSYRSAMTRLNGSFLRQGFFSIGQGGSINTLRKETSLWTLKLYTYVTLSSIYFDSYFVIYVVRVTELYSFRLE